MSRIGKKPITIPAQTEVSVANGVISVKGPKGVLTRNYRGDISVTVESEGVVVKPARQNKQTAALWGTYASHIKNMIAGVNKPYEKKLVLEGVGYKSEVKPASQGGGATLGLALGFSHPVNVTIPEGLALTAEKNVITITGIDKELVGQFAASIRAMKKPEPYKGKGFRYSGEVIRRKQGKKST
jgi:large subunit ribosomal protein L6